MPSTNESFTNPATLLRRITIYSFLLAFPLLLAHGIASGRAVPALGLLPLAGSAALAALILYRDRVTTIGSPIQPLSVSNIFFADFVLAALLLGILIGSWVDLTKEYWRETSLIILGTYGTVFMIANFAIHLYFVAIRIPHMVISRACDCAHCRSVVKKSSFATMMSASEYTPLSEGDEEDEAAYRDLESGTGRSGP